MTEKTIVVVKRIVAIVLIVAIGAGLFFGGRWVFQKIDAYTFDQSTHNDDGTTKLPNGSSADTSKPDDTTTPDDTTDSGNTTPAFYINEETQTGYSRLANVTFFFKVIEPEERFCDIHGMVETPRILNVTMKSYGLYDINMRYSYDGQLWSSFGDYNTDFSAWEASFGIDGKIYISYTAVTDCADPTVILDELTVNVFEDSNVFVYALDCLPG